MILALRATGAALAQVLTHFTAYLLGNVVAVVLCAPIVLAVGVLGVATRSFSLIPLGVALLIGVLPNPLTAGVHSLAHELSSGQYITFADYWTGLRCYWRIATVAWGLSAGVSLVILANMAFYAHAAGTAAGLLRTLAGPLFLLWVLLFVVWIGVHLYVFPLLIIQEVKSLRLVYRNAALMLAGRPAVALVALPIWVCVLVVSSATGLLTIVGLALGVSLQHTTTARVLPLFRLEHAG